MPQKLELMPYSIGLYRMDSEFSVPFQSAKEAYEGSCLGLGAPFTFPFHVCSHAGYFYAVKKKYAISELIWATHTLFFPGTDGLVP